ncbi:hypothetical protein A8926_7435 [Saccharopolyspora spinosa]|uniref:Uncharacterized protein n=1 Tax=Saccharopolyspora spinosa TaxID=60894 RepID=A0A2N3Y8R6_SACSN|nr:hypothetical protein A8926_7435 [Saccharopolyspora spinosa]
MSNDEYSHVYGLDESGKRSALCGTGPGPAAKYRELVSLNSVSHWIQSGATKALCGVPLTSLHPRDPSRQEPSPCSFCPGELARQLRNASAR